MSKIKAGSAESTSIEHISDTSGILELDSENGVVSFINTAGITLPAGTTAQRPASAVPGSLRINTSTGYMEIFYNSLWNPLTNLVSEPIWTTASGSLGIIYEAERDAKSFTVVATDTDPTATISYSLASGTLPTGMTINSSTGVISGTASAVVTDTTHSFTIRATNNSGAFADRAFNIISRAPIVTIYSYTGSDQTFTVPSGISRVRFKLWGAGGSGLHTTGGTGGFTQSTIATNSGTVYTLIVGQASYSRDNGTNYGGGKRSNLDSGNGGGDGGGRSAVRLANTNEILTAGGGGGGAHGSGGAGGAGGGLTGTNGSGTYAGTGGTQTAGGTGSCGNSCGSAGSQFLGGGTGTGWTGGGGGGGWYGGAGGGGVNGAHDGGGGGSGWVGRNGSTTLTGNEYGSIASPQDTSGRTDSVYNITYYNTICIRNNNTSDSNWGNSAGNAGVGTASPGRIVVIY